MHKTQRRVMLKFLKQHNGKWVERAGHNCDLCYCEYIKETQEPITLASYISKSVGRGPYSSSPPRLCTEHARELGLLW